MKWIVTGGCGFIGTNAVLSFVEAGDEVVVLDAVTRPNVHRSLSHLRDDLGVECHVVDVRDRDGVDRVIAAHPDADAVLHLAGQVSLVASIAEPRHDMEVNVLGTLNVLEATRRHAADAVVLYSSTNKVYGDLGHIPIREQETRYAWTDRSAVDENVPLDFHGGYGCSKGAADQYVLDYHRTYGLRTASLRQSSVYGGHQYATADQGWVAFFAHTALREEPCTISGNGKQVRDVLHVDDLVDLYRRCAEHADDVAGRALNVGGGADRSLSLLELFALLEERFGLTVEYTATDWRPSDQRIFIADNTRATQLTGWAPSIDVEQGLDELVDWTRRNR